MIDVDRNVNSKERLLNIDNGVVLRLEMVVRSDIQLKNGLCYNQTGM